MPKSAVWPQSAVALPLHSGIKGVSPDACKRERIGSEMIELTDGFE